MFGMAPVLSTKIVRTGTNLTVVGPAAKIGRKIAETFIQYSSLRK